MSSEPIVASNISHESLEKYVEEISNLPKEQGWRPLKDLCLYQNFWFYPFFLQGALYARDHFRPRPTDIFLCSSMKTGSTWLKALSFTIATRGSHRLDGSDPTIPLRTTVPHDCIPFLEFNEYSTTTTVAAEGSKIQLYASHLPYTCLPKSIHDSNCRIVYICRDPKDTFVSLWFFLKKFVSNQTKTDPDPDPDQDHDTVSLIPIEEAFDLFCKGISSYGPYWEHVLSYWEASKRNPENILIIKYEDMVKDTGSWVRKLAEFFGCGFSEEEEEKGVVERVVEMCSFESLRDMEVNKSGMKHEKRGKEIESSAYFRKGIVGHWRNYLSDEMGKKIDGIVEEKLRGSGFRF